MRDRLGLERGDAAADGGDADVLEPHERGRRRVARVPLLAVERLDQRARGAGVADLTAGAGGGGAHEPGARAVHARRPRAARRSRGRRSCRARGRRGRTARRRGRAAAAVSSGTASNARSSPSTTTIRRRRCGWRGSPSSVRSSLTESGPESSSTSAIAPCPKWSSPSASAPRISSSTPTAPTRVSACAHAKRTSGSRSRRPLRSAGTRVEPSELADDLGGAHAVQHHARAQRRAPPRR